MGLVMEDQNYWQWPITRSEPQEVSVEVVDDQGVAYPLDEAVIELTIVHPGGTLTFSSEDEDVVAIEAQDDPELVGLFKINLGAEVVALLPDGVVSTYRLDIVQEGERTNHRWGEIAVSNWPAGSGLTSGGA